MNRLNFRLRIWSGYHIPSCANIVLISKTYKRHIYIYIYLYIHILYMSVCVHSFLRGGSSLFDVLVAVGAPRRSGRCDPAGFENLRNSRWPTKHASCWSILYKHEEASLKLKGQEISEKTGSSIHKGHMNGMCILLREILHHLSCGFVVVGDPAVHRSLGIPRFWYPGARLMVASQWPAFSVVGSSAFLRGIIRKVGSCCL